MYKIIIYLFSNIRFLSFLDKFIINTKLYQNKYIISKTNNFQKHLLIFYK